MAFLGTTCSRAVVWGSSALKMLHAGTCNYVTDYVIASSDMLEIGHQKPAEPRATSVKHVVAPGTLLTQHYVKKRAGLALEAVADNSC